MTSKAHVWKTQELARLFLDDVRGALPLAAEQLAVVSRLAAAARPDLADFLDLGCGNGPLGRALLQRFPRARGVFLDFSPPMLQAARDEIGPTDAHRFVQADLASPAWLDALGCGASFDAVVSGLAIHHLPDGRKRDLYGEVHALLRPGGLFLNLEHVSSPTEWVSRRHEEEMVDALLAFDAARDGRKTREEVTKAFRRQQQDTGNILAPVELQCRWLRDLGFQHVDCYFKLFEFALFGGLRAV